MRSLSELLPRIVVFFLVTTLVRSQWPMPQQMRTTEKTLKIDPSQFKFLTVGPGGQGKCEVIEEGIKRYQEVIFLNDCSRLGGEKNDETRNHLTKSPFESSNLTIKNDETRNHLTKSPFELSNLTIWINHQCETIPYQDMDEMYTIRIGTEDFRSSAVILANHVWGALRGLETFSQLVKPSILSSGLFEINETFILDYPRFSFRGLLLDTSRHYLPVQVIYDNLDAMAYNKMNVFHWHIVDDNSFPFVSETFPQLSGLGAFNNKTHIYTKEDVANVIEYGRLRGIRIIPEFDSPGHIESWAKSQPGFITPCNNTSPFSSPMDPTNEKNYEFLEKLFSEVANVFPENFLHLGGDEVNFGCWKNNSHVVEFMKQNHINTFEQLQSYHMKKVIEIVKKLEKSYMVWQEVFDNDPEGLKDDTIVHIWLGHVANHSWDGETLNVTSKGYKVVLSSPWYLNYINYGVDWPQFYNQEPVPVNASENQAKLVLGGEVCMWGEHVDGSNCISRTWPRAAAVAERLWSARIVNITNSNAAPRLSEQQCRMQMRGLRVEPINGPGFCKCDHVLH